jgi:hypothetical protein
LASMTVAQALENVYTSLKNDNQDIDLHIDALKGALATEGKKEALVEPAKLVQNNRQGRKMMQSYFKKRGVTVVFKEA